MVRKSGPLACALYYKQAKSSNMMAYGSDSLVVPSGIFPISLTRGGFPRVIPSFHRRMIYRRDEKADALVKFDLSLFSVTGIIPLAKRVSKKTFTGIVSPPDDIETVVGFVGLIKSEKKILLT